MAKALCRLKAISQTDDVMSLLRFAYPSMVRLIQNRNHATADDIQDRISTLIAGSKTYTPKSTVKFDPSGKIVQADWIAWLSREVNYNTWFEDYFAASKLENLRKMQEYSTERTKMFGPELLAARFTVAMMGKVKLYNDNHWYSKWTTKTNPLPSNKTPNLRVEAIDLSSTDLLYEGIENLFGAHSLLHLSLAKCSRLDEWSISRLAMIPSIVSLDLSGNQFITERSLIPLQHIPNLRKLDLGGIDYFKNQPLALLMLEEHLPNCVIVNVSDNLSIPSQDTPGGDNS